MADAQIRCGCPAAHPWRAQGIDDPEELTPSPAHEALASRPPIVVPGRDVTQRTAHASRWFAEENPQKRLIVLHYTEGGLPSWWSQCNATPVRDAAGDVTGAAVPTGLGATSLGVGRDGSIVQYYPPECWNHNSTAGVAVHKRAIAIELANLGWAFEEREGERVTYRTRCARLEDRSGFLDWDELPRENVTNLPDHFRRVPWGSGTREVACWHGFPDAQIDALADLIRALCQTYGVPQRFLPAAERFQTLWPRGSGGAGHEGIVSHVNFVQDQPGLSPKWDIGPAFPWGRLAARLQAAEAPVGRQTVFQAPTRPDRTPVAASLVLESSLAALRQLEERLNAMGFDCGAADGIVDGRTRDGVRAFQAATGLPVDGRITAALRAAVLREYTLREASGRLMRPPWPGARDPHRGALGVRGL